jgi:hypothetical protein
MRAALAVLLLAAACVACDICSPTGQTRCRNPTTLEVCNDGDWLPQACNAADAGTTACQSGADGGSCV